MEILIRRRQGDVQLRLRLHLGLAGDLLGIEVLVAGIKELTQHAVERLAVIQFVIVRAGAVVDVRPQRVLAAVEGEDRPGGVHERRKRVARGETAIILGVEGQQRRPWRPHRRQVGVVGQCRQVVGGLFRITQVLQVPDAGENAGVARHRIGQRHPRIQPADEDCLPPAAGKAGHGHATGIGMGQAQQQVQASLQ